MQYTKFSEKTDATKLNTRKQTHFLFLLLLLFVGNGNYQKRKLNSGTWHLSSPLSISPYFNLLSWTAPQTNSSTVLGSFSSTAHRPIRCAQLGKDCLFHYHSLSLLLSALDRTVPSTEPLFNCLNTPYVVHLNPAAKSMWNLSTFTFLALSEWRKRFTRFTRLCQSKCPRSQTEKRFI